MKWPSCGWGYNQLFSVILGLEQKTSTRDAWGTLNYLKCIIKKSSILYFPFRSGKITETGRCCSLKSFTLWNKSANRFYHKRQADYPLHCVLFLMLEWKEGASTFQCLQRKSFFIMIFSCMHWLAIHQSLKSKASFYFNYWGFPS